jgi:hypothetical protein
VNPEDYPQTDGRKFPTSIDVSLNGAATRWELPDDPANARGVLSHWAGVERGSFGYLKTISAEGAPASDQITIRMTSNEGGLAIYGEDMGCYPMDPTIILHLKNDVPDIRSDEPITVDRYLDRLKPVLPTARESGTTWRYTTEAPPSDWTLGGFDDSGWKEGLSGFGTEGTPGATVRTVWDGPQIWLRKTVTISKSELMLLRVHHDEDCEIYVNGKLLWKEGGYTTDYRTIHLTPAQIALFYDGTNTIGVHCRQTAGGQYIDVGLLGLYP